MEETPQIDSTDNSPHFKPAAIIGVIIFALFGAALALYATQLTFKLTVAGIVEPSECSFNDWLTCDTVLSTGYAKIFGVPVAWLGFLYFFWAFFVAVFALLNRRKESGKAALDIVFFISFISVLFSIYKMYQLFELKVICPVCVTMYVSIFGIFFLSKSVLSVKFKDILRYNINYLKRIFSRTKKETPMEQSLSHPLRYIVILLWFFAMGYLGLRYYENTVIKPSLASVQLILTKHFSQDKTDINTEEAPVTGNPDSKIKIVEFSDFECPACRLLSSNMKAIMLEYGDRVSFTFMNYPLDKSINPNVKNDIHKNAGLAAIAGLCAQEQGKFWEFHYKLFENQTEISPNFINETANELGMDMNSFNMCLESNEIKERVISSINTGKSIGVSGTPTLFINGRKVHYWNSSEVIKAIIEEEIKVNRD